MFGMYAPHSVFLGLGVVHVLGSLPLVQPPT